ncbi:MAG TPA: hypothetical protein ENK43_15150 [Planctomycetes bacterium]|nr:hypothetical protein [Planctomycetota bacterium]
MTTNDGSASAQRPSAPLLFLLVLVAAMGASAQSGLGPQETLFDGAAVFIDGKFVKDAGLLVSGSKIRNVGVEIPDRPDATRVDAKGKWITPVLIDASSVLGIDRALGGTPGRIGNNSSARPRHDVTDLLDPFDVRPERDALAQGIGYVFLRYPSRSRFGGRGSAIRLPAEPGDDASAWVVDGTSALQVRVADKGGPLARMLSVAAFEKELKSAKSYGEAWEKYRKALKEYEEKLAEWAKKQPKSKDDKSKSKKPKSEPSKKRVPARRRTPRRRPPRSVEAAPAEVRDAVWPVWVTPAALVAKALSDGRPVDVLPYPIPPAELLQPRPTFPDDGTEPWRRTPQLGPPLDFSSLEVAVCPECGAALEGKQKTHSHEEGWDFFEFAPTEPASLSTVAPSFESPSAKNGKSKSSKSGAAPKKPRRPRRDPDKERIFSALKGKLKVRIEVHRAADIVAVLEILKKYPLDAVLEGVTEGYLVADAIAEAGVPVLLNPWPRKPRQEKKDSGAESGQAVHFGGRTFFFPRPRSTSPSTTDARGRFSPTNAAVLKAKGVPVSFASLGGNGRATLALLARAGQAATAGFDRDDVLEAVTANAADILGVGAKIGRLAPGRKAAFVVWSGHPLDPTSRVESVYIDGKPVFSK